MKYHPEWKWYRFTFIPVIFNVMISLLLEGRETFLFMRIWSRIALYKMQPLAPHVYLHVNINF